MPLFSIITVTYNAGANLPATLRSVAGQTCTDFEYLLIDGASTDNTLELAHAASIPNMRIVSKPDRGLYDAMNRGLKLAKGEYVIFLNAGDSFPAADTLRLYADAAKSHPDADLIYGQTELVNGARQVIGPRHFIAPENLTAKDFRHGMLVCHQAMAVRRSIAPAYDLRYRFSADYDWSVKVLKASRRNVFIPATTAYYLAEGITTANHRASLMERFLIMCRHFGVIPTVWEHIKKIIKSA